MFKDKIILILGGTGTLGSEILDQLLKTDVKSIRVYNRHEHSQFLLMQKYDDKRIRYHLGDIRDKDRLNKSFKGVDICFNCAAIKHVSIANQNPFEAVKTNVNGAQNAIDCSIENDIEAFIQISTDKAVSPCSLYGATKMVAEYLTLNAFEYQGYTRTKFMVVRLGNILNSSGSVMEVWEHEFAENKPLTVTDLNAERYMATKEDIVKNVLEIADKPENGLFVSMMQKYKLSELLDKFLREKGVEKYPFRIIGLRPGEKLIEELFTADEAKICKFNDMERGV